MTTIYLIRHSKKYDLDFYESFKVNENRELSLEKIVLDVEGEKMAERLSEDSEFDNMDKVYTSNNLRTLQTAKYLLEKQKLRPNIDERFNEKRVGIRNDKNFPNWYTYQFENRDYKTIGGESVNDVYERFSEAFFEVVNDNKDKRVAIFTHGNAISFFLVNVVDSYTVNKDRIFNMKFNNEEIFNGKINYLETFKFNIDDDLSIKDIKNVKHKGLKL